MIWRSEARGYAARVIMMAGIYPRGRIHYGGPGDPDAIPSPYLDRLTVTEVHLTGLRLFTENMDLTVLLSLWYPWP